MHRDALATLGESLRREFQDLLHNDAAALADLAGDAQRLLASLDHQLQALAAWLTSSSVLADVPFAASLPTEEVAPGQQTSLPPDAQRVSSSQAVPRPAADSGAPLPPDALPGVTGTQDDLPIPDHTSDTDGARGTTAHASSLPVLLPATHVFPADAAAPKRREATRPYPVWRDPDLHIRQAALLDTFPLTSSSTRGEPYAPRMAAANSEQTDRVDAPTRGQQLAVTVPLEPPGGEADGLACAPLEASGPPPTAMGTFTPLNNLHDLARFLSPGDYAASVPVATAATATSAEATSDAAGDTTSMGERVSARADAWRPVTFLAPTQEQAPAQPLSEVRVHSVRRDMLPEGNNAGERTATPPQEEVPEVDVESLVDILARRVAEEYRRFYGS